VSVHPSGKQFRISAGGHAATIVEVGGGVREYTVDGQPVLQPYPLEAMCDGAHGAPLIPWPNRLAGGRYTFGGVDYQVALSEPEKNNAIHGFLRWRSWHPLRHEPDRVTTATNSGEQACPYGCGQHPYLSPGDGLVDDCTLHLDAATRITTNDQRQLPTGRQPVEGTRYDFRDGRRLADLQVDYAFTDLTRDNAGKAWTRLVRPDGTSAELWIDQAYPIVEIYTADTLAPARRRRGMGTEPMTCPPNALQTGEGVIALQPGSSSTSSWGAVLR